MKPFIVLLLLTVAALLPPAAKAQTNVTSSDTVTLGWNPNSESDLAGYRLYFTQNTNAWTHAKNVGLVTQATVHLPSPGKWFFTLTAINDANLESLPSNLVEYTTPNGPSRNSTFRLVSASAVRASTITVVTNLTFQP